MKKLVFVLFLLVSTFAFSQQLTYKPMNTFFGGDTFNYQIMLSSANSQNSFSDPNAPSRDLNSMDQFAESLNRQLLNQLSRSLFNQQFGGELQEGSFVFGSLAIEIYETGEGMVINILNTDTGEQTQIILPI